MKANNNKKRQQTIVQQMEASIGKELVSGWEKAYEGWYSGETEENPFEQKDSSKPSC